MMNWYRNKIIIPVLQQRRQSRRPAYQHTSSGTHGSGSLHRLSHCLKPAGPLFNRFGDESNGAAADMKAVFSDGIECTGEALVGKAQVSPLPIIRTPTVSWQRHCAGLGANEDIGGAGTWKACAYCQYSSQLLTDWYDMVMMLIVCRTTDNGAIQL
jgi:hypothetical protein